MRSSEADFFEAALLYHSHGGLRASSLPKASALADGAEASVAGVARLGAYIGSRSALLCGAAGGLRALPNTEAEALGAATTAATARAGEPDGPEAAPRHVCAELVEPCGPLYAGRTYFWGSGARAPPRGVAEEVEELLGDDEGAGPIRRKTGARAAIAAAAAAAEASALEDPRLPDSDALQGVYGALVAAFDAVIARHDAPAMLCVEADTPPAHSAPSALVRAIVDEMVPRLMHAELLSGVSAAAATERLLARISLEVGYVDILGHSYRDAPAAAHLTLAGRLLLHTRLVVALAGLMDSTTHLGALVLGDTYAVTHTATATPRLTCLSHGLSRMEVWRAAGPENEASSDLSTACEAASRIFFGRDGIDPSAGSLKPKMAPHALVGGLLGEPLAEVLEGCALLTGAKGLHPVPLSLYAFERGAVLVNPRVGTCHPYPCVHVLATLRTRACHLAYTRLPPHVHALAPPTPRLYFVPACAPSPWRQCALFVGRTPTLQPASALKATARN